MSKAQDAAEGIVLIAGALLVAAGLGVVLLGCGGVPAPKTRDLMSSWDDAQRFFEGLWP